MSIPNYGRKQGNRRKGKHVAGVRASVQPDINAQTIVSFTCEISRLEFLGEKKRRRRKGAAP